MLSAQGEAGNSKSDKGSAAGERRFSWPMILIGLALLACAVLLYLYSASNRPSYKTTSDTTGNINPAPPADRR